MKKYAILIGNSQFPDETDKSKLPDLACPEKDVDGLSTVLASERGEFEVLSLKNQPSYQILRELQRKVKQADSEDLLLLYYSGHGKPNKSGLLHLTTLDTVIAELETSAIPMNRVYDILGTGKARKIVILLDCCYSGAAGQGFKGAVDDQLQQLNNARGTYLVTASTELQVAHESAEEGLSLFTKHLIAGLETGEADKDGDGWVSMDELYDYVQGMVVAENPAQQPTKHVKEERGGLLIAKSGRDSRKERAEKIRLLLLELEKQDESVVEIKAEALSIAKTPTSQLSATELQKDELLDELLTQKIKFFLFTRKWERLSFELEKTKETITAVEQKRLTREKEWQERQAQEKKTQEKSEQESFAQKKVDQDKLIQETLPKEQSVQARIMQEEKLKQSLSRTLYLYLITTTCMFIMIQGYCIQLSDALNSSDKLINENVINVVDYEKTHLISKQITSSLQHLYYLITPLTNADIQDCKNIMQSQEEKRDYKNISSCFVLEKGIALPMLTTMLKNILPLILGVLGATICSIRQLIKGKLTINVTGMISMRLCLGGLLGVISGIAVFADDAKIPQGFDLSLVIVSLSIGYTSDVVLSLFDKVLDWLDSFKKPS